MNHPVLSVFKVINFFRAFIVPNEFETDQSVSKFWWIDPGNNRKIVIRDDHSSFSGAIVTQSNWEHSSLSVRWTSNLHDNSRSIFNLKNAESEFASNFQNSLRLIHRRQENYIFVSLLEMHKTVTRSLANSRSQTALSVMANCGTILGGNHYCRALFYDPEILWASDALALMGKRKNFVHLK